MPAQGLVFVRVGLPHLLGAATLGQSCWARWNRRALPVFGAVAVFSSDGADSSAAAFQLADMGHIHSASPYRLTIASSGPCLGFLERRPP